MPVLSQPPHNQDRSAVCDLEDLLGPRNGEDGRDEQLVKQAKRGGRTPGAGLKTLAPLQVKILERLRACDRVACLLRYPLQEELDPSRPVAGLADAEQQPVVCVPPGLEEGAQVEQRERQQPPADQQE